MSFYGWHGVNGLVGVNALDEPIGGVYPYQVEFAKFLVSFEEKTKDWDDELGEEIEFWNPVNQPCLTQAEVDNWQTTVVSDTDRYRNFNVVSDPDVSVYTLIDGAMFDDPNKILFCVEALEAAIPVDVYDYILDGHEKALAVIITHLRNDTLIEPTVFSGAEAHVNKLAGVE